MNVLCLFFASAAPFSPLLFGTAFAVQRLAWRHERPFLWVSLMFLSMLFGEAAALIAFGWNPIALVFAVVMLWLIHAR